MTESAVEVHLASIADSMATLVEENRDLRERLDAALLRIEAQTEADRARVDADRKRTRAYRLTVAVAVVVALTFGGVLLDNQRALRESEQKWCPILGVLISGPPPTTPRGEWARDAFGRLFTGYQCTPADIANIPDVPTPSPSPGQS